MRFRVIAKSPADFQEWLSEQQQGPVNPLYTDDADGKQVPAGPTQKLIVNTFACTNCHIFDDSSKAAYGPNLTHLASRTTFASGSYPLTREQPHQLGEGRAVDDPDVVTGLPAPTG